MKNLHQYIDHTLLKQNCSSNDIALLCNEAIVNNFYAVCVPPIYVEQAKLIVKDNNVKVATVIGFPMGYNSTDAKIVEVDVAIENGADELDVVMNIADLINEEYDYIVQELSLIKNIAKDNNVLVKIIIESGILTDNQIIKACAICTEANIDFVKTSTGFASSGASIHAVSLMRKHLPQHIKIKASGGIKTLADALAYINAGASRIGTSNGIAIINGEKLNSVY